MNSLGEPDHVDELSCVRQCPPLRNPLLAGGFLPARFAGSDPQPEARPELVARYAFPESRESYVFRVKPCAHGNRWYAWGDYCASGRRVADACYDFLDGGGSFQSRAAAEWAIHTYVMHLHAQDHSNSLTSHDPESVC